MLNLDELEKLAKGVDPLPWKLNLHLGKVVRYTEHGKERFIADCLRVTKRDKHCKKNAAYIVAACNTVPELIAENRALGLRVRELELREAEYIEEREALLCTKYALERERDWLADRFSGEYGGMPASKYFLHCAKEATKEME